MQEQALHTSPNTRLLIVKTNWSTFEDQQMNGHTVSQLLSNQIPVVRAKGFLTLEECEKMLAILKTHEMARSLQLRWKTEAGIDILDRVAGKIQEVTGVPHERGERGRQGVFRWTASVAAVAQEENHGSGTKSAQSSEGWTVTNIAAQLSWNIVLNPVYGGETIIYDRVWNAPADEQAWQKEIDFDTYHKKMLEGRPFKVMLPVPGDLTLFNTRDHPVPETRYTVSSFIGYKPPRSESDPGALVLWS
ncbi:signal transduction protein [Apiospora hydei]|uniref:Signal transduction protein n=1 Tax=Apiospora hydei TaxID=1337664 RepID=A0ABR1V8A9_9PEZI